MDRHLISSMNKAMCGHHFQYRKTWQHVTPLLSHGTHSCMKCAIIPMNKAMCGHHFQYCNTWQRVTPLLSNGTHSCMKCAIIPSNDCLLYHQLNNTVVGPHFKQSNTVQHQHPGPVDPVNQYSQGPWVCWPDQSPNKELP